MIWKAMIIPSLGYIVGLILGIYYYRKPRKYIQHEEIKNNDSIVIKPYVLIVTVISILATFLVQLVTDSMIFGALAGVLVFFVSRAYKWTELDKQFVDGIKIMSFIGVGTASALGDSGSPASDSTLGPTAGLDIDGQHDHIRDTCIPNFVFYNIPLIIFGTIAAMIL